MVAASKLLFGLAAANLVAASPAMEAMDHTKKSHKGSAHPKTPTLLASFHSSSYGWTHTTYKFPYTSHVTAANSTYTTTLTATRKEYWVFATYDTGPTAPYETYIGTLKRAATTPAPTAGPIRPREVKEEMDNDGVISNVPIDLIMPTTTTTASPTVDKRHDIAHPTGIHKLWHEFNCYVEYDPSYCQHDREYQDWQLDMCVDCALKSKIQGSPYTPKPDREICCDRDLVPCGPCWVWIGCSTIELVSSFYLLFLMVEIDDENTLMMIFIIEKNRSPA